MLRATISVLALCVLCVAGCDNSPSEPQNQTLRLSFTGLDPLANGYHYEGWAIVGGSPVTTGKFNVDAQGALVSTGGTAIAGGAFETRMDLGAATAIVITIEPSGDVDAVPTATHIMAGSVSGGSAVLTVGDGSALGNDFLSAAGDYILATPTDGADTNESSGIWFLSLATGTPATGLTLPTLPLGWAYEGWVVMGGAPVTTGRFTAVDAADLSAPFSGTEAGPPFPGEDFLQNAPTGTTFPTDLAGATAVISIEPEPDDAAGPFTLKPLVAGIPAAAADHVTYSLGNNVVASFPTGTAAIN